MLKSRVGAYPLIAICVCLALLGSSRSRGGSQAKEINAVLHRMDVAVGNGNYRELLGTLDASTIERLKSAVERDFAGEAAKLMAFLQYARHPARFRRLELRVSEVVERDECSYAEVVLTQNYSTYHHKSISPEFENKPVEMWICFVSEADSLKIRLTYPIHDIIYLVQ